MESSVTPEARNMEAAMPELTSHIRDMANSVQGKLNSLEAIVNSGFSKNQDSLANVPKTSFFNSFLAHIGNFTMLSSIDTDRSETAAAIGETVVDPELSATPTIKNLFINHKSVTSIYNEWYGLESFSTHQGGIDFLEKNLKSSWRTHFNAADQKKLSRMKFIVRKIDERAGLPGESIQSSLIYFDRLFANDYKSISALETYLKKSS